MHCQDLPSSNLTGNPDPSLQYELIVACTTSSGCPSGGETDLLNFNELCKEFYLHSYGSLH